MTTDEQIGGAIRNSFLTLVGQALEKDSSDNEGGPIGGVVETREEDPRQETITPSTEGDKEAPEEEGNKTDGGNGTREKPWRSPKSVNNSEDAEIFGRTRGTERPKQATGRGKCAKRRYKRGSNQNSVLEKITPKRRGNCKKEATKGSKSRKEIPWETK